MSATRLICNSQTPVREELDSRIRTSPIFDMIIVLYHFAKSESWRISVNRISSTSTLAVMLLLATTLQAFQDEAKEVWPGWRGPTMNGHAADSARPPIKWSENENVKWKTELSGLGNSTPSVWGDKVILTYARPTGKTADVAGTDAAGNPKPNEFHELFVTAYDLETGKEIWQTKVAESLPNAVSHPTGSIAAASTVTDGKKIYAFFGSLGLFALDMDGKQVWNYELPPMQTLANFGEGASPALKDNILVIPWDEQGQSFIAGIDTASGKEAWRTERSSDSAWITPLIVDDGDKHVVIVSGTTYTRAYDLQSGKEVWNCGGMSSNPTSSPVADGNVVFIGNSYKGNIVQAIRFDGAKGDLSQSKNLLWTHRKSASYVPTPIVVDGKLYFLKNSVGILNCLDAATGEPVAAAKRLKLKTVHASPMMANGNIYISSREGDTVVIDPAQDCEILATNHLDDVFGASPVAIGKNLILRGNKSLYCLE